MIFHAIIIHDACHGYRFLGNGQLGVQPLTPSALNLCQFCYLFLGCDHSCHERRWSGRLIHVIITSSTIIITTSFQRGSIIMCLNIEALAFLVHICDLACQPWLGEWPTRSNWEFQTQVMSSHSEIGVAFHKWNFMDDL